MSDRRIAGKATTPGGAPVSAAGQRRAREGAVVTVYEDGPLIVRGQFTLTAQDGQPIPAALSPVMMWICSSWPPTVPRWRCRR